MVVRNDNVKTYNAFVLVEWQSMQDTSWWEEENDAPWWYNERASLSLFAGAVWKCKGWVFEEFITKKHMTTRRGKRKNRHGQGDIMFGIKGQGFVAEAKQCWPNIGRNIDSVLKEDADSWTIFGNSGDVPKMIAFEESGKIEILDPDIFGTLLKHKEEQ